jgi:hypothetical protein
VAARDVRGLRANRRLRLARSLFVGFAFRDDRQLGIDVRFCVVVFVLGVIIVVVGVSRRHRVAHDGDEVPADKWLELLK